MDRVVQFVCSRTERELLAAGLLLRLGMVLYSAIHDQVFEVRYTDIDYDVVTDGSHALWTGGSPFDRVTYRYSPLLAAVMLPNAFAFYAFGKLLLSLCDVVAAGYAFDTFARTAGRAAIGNDATWRNPKFMVSAFLLFNPVVINVSTRGNSDTITTLLILGALSSFSRRAYAVAGLFLGFSIHIRIYPIVYVPCFVFALLQRVATHGAKTGSGRSTKPALVGGQHRSFPALARAAWTPEFLSGLVSAAVGVTVAAGVPTVLCYAWLGQQYLDEALLYHIGRIDHRHNFSPYWYPMYLGMAARDVPGALGVGVEPAVAWLKTGLAAFVPQLGALLAAAWILRRHVAHSVTVVTMIFITFNKVCTVQYFVWFLPLLPFVFATTQTGHGHGAASPGYRGVLNGFVIGAVWFGCLVWWMVQSVRVEFHNEQAFVSLWFASVFFFLMEVIMTRAVAAAAVRMQKSEFGL
jgi:phosphatidylinositol glycan class M